MLNSNCKLRNNYNYLENNIAKYIELKDTKKKKIIEYNFYNTYRHFCKCEQKTDLLLKKENFIKEDILNILEEIKKTYNATRFQDLSTCQYRCDINDLDVNDNVYNFIFTCNDNNFEIEPQVVHCYSYVKDKYIHICLHVNLLSFLCVYLGEASDYQMRVMLKY